MSQRKPRDTLLNLNPQPYFPRHSSFTCPLSFHPPSLRGRLLTESSELLRTNRLPYVQCETDTPWADRRGFGAYCVIVLPCSTARHAD